MTKHDSFVAKIPNAVLITAYSARVDRKADANAFVAELKVAIDRHRYEQVRNADQVQIGIWNGAIHDHARWLLQKNRKDDAVAALRTLVVAAPFNYQAHGDLIDSAPDPAVARASASVVFDNAEDIELIRKAARTLGRSIPEIVGLPALTKDEGNSLHVVLVVLPPCNLMLVREAARLYENAIGIPVRISRLVEPFDFGTPSRMPEQRTIQREIIKKNGPAVKFDSWTQERYQTELLKTVERSDPLTKFLTESFIAKLAGRAGQYDAAPLIHRLADTLAKYRPPNIRAMYVGVTGADIYVGDTNYLFAAGSTMNGVNTVILSYARMTTKMTGERYQSRKRLAERLAKQLVPATLSSLGIARPADPTDAYSFVDSLERVDQKTLTLSTPTKEALEKFR